MPSPEVFSVNGELLACSINSKCQGTRRKGLGQQITSEVTCGGTMCKNSVKERAQDSARRASVLAVARTGAERECNASR